jgi:hypothetical protein
LMGSVVLHRQQQQCATDDAEGGAEARAHPRDSRRSPIVWEVFSATRGVSRLYAHQEDVQHGQR